MNSRRILEQFRSRQAELQALIAVHEQVRTWAEADSSKHQKYSDYYRGRPHGFPEDRTGDGSASLDEIGHMLNQKLIGISEELAVALHMVDLAEDSIDRAILHTHYILGDTWGKTAKQVHMSKSQTRKRAKKVFEKIDEKMSTYEHP